MQQTYWIGSASPADATVIDLGPDHPTRAGAVEIACDVDGGLITRAQVGIGRMHRGAEKLFEVRDYRQGLGLANRHDWQAPSVGETSLALAVEQALGIQVPPRATWLRTIAVEHARLHTLLAMLLPAVEPATAVALRGLRERSRAQLMAWTGSRLHPMAVRIGGLEYDVDDAWIAAERELADAARAALVDTIPTLPGTDGIARIDGDLVDGLGLSGPAARAAGLGRDLRTQSPTLAYADLPALEITETDGDAAARLRQLRVEALHSWELITLCCERLEPGEIDVRLPKIIRLPEGEYYVPLEAPFGEAGLRVVSRGEKTPWRVFLRSPSQANVLALETILVGQPPETIAPTIASLGWVVGDVDK